MAITLATAMRAANVADFYMTKYQSKPQEKLGSILQPFLAGMRRIDAEEAKETGGQQRPIQELARRRVRRFIFSANRTMWFSACDLSYDVRPSRQNGMCNEYILWQRHGHDARVQALAEQQHRV